MRQTFNAIFRQGFFRSVSILVGGTVFAQAIMVLVLPLLTRLYTPEDFNVLAVYASILGIISVAACLRFEIAIPLPQRDDEAVNLLALALFSSTFFSVIAALLVFLFPAVIISFIAQPRLEPYLWFFPLGLWFTSSYAALQFWATRKKRFGVVTKTRVAQAIGGAGVQVGLGWAGIAPIGLLLGHLLNSGAGVFGLAFNFFKNEKKLLNSVNLINLKAIFLKYDKFPKYSTFESLANSASIELPILIIAALAVGPEAGFLMLASRVMSAPMALVGGSVSQVYLSRAPDELRAGTLDQFTESVLVGLAKIGVGPLIFIGIVAPIVFPIIFGEQWQRAGVFLTWMTPWFIMQFMSVPVSMALHVTSHQRAALLLQIAGLGLRVLPVLIAAYFAPRLMVEVYAVFGFIFYVIYFIVILLTVDISGVGFKNSTAKIFFILSGWVVMGLVVNFSLKLMK
ncbi:hypothetical protein CBP36_03030 [Acidovorax carolinensis]|uniref:Polysaccharide biosynthesis protein n=1 Tax=Acidovorax carolinensis TaxID=553814 RepID=A0A240U8Z4_9BURK|nr:oligosaccharide flippase family protein [Acidovorax carolinensis]ART56106.1 hypothetical protein CBP35_15910 [Acidovorax carolinensis]ART57968.1 hypothetical protein CBP36_03030 [Acidovorax carolinensis]